MSGDRMHSRDYDIQCTVRLIFQTPAALLDGLSERLIGVFLMCSFDHIDL